MWATSSRFKLDHQFRFMTLPNRKQLKCCNIVPVVEMSPAKHPVVSVPSLPLFMLINHAGGLLFRSLIGGCIKVVNCTPVVGLRTVWWARGRWCMQAQLDQTVTLGRNAAELGCLWRISELVGCHAPGAAPMAISRLRVSHDALNIRHYTTNLELAVARSKNS